MPEKPITTKCPIEAATREALAKKFEGFGGDMRFSGRDVAYLIRYLVISDEVDGHA